MNSLTTYWLQRDVHSPAEGPLPKGQILMMLKRRVIGSNAVVNEPGQPSWMRVGDVFAPELKKWRRERLMMQWAIGAVVGLALVTISWVGLQNSFDYYNSPEAEAARYETSRQKMLTQAKRLERYETPRKESLTKHLASLPEVKKLDYAMTDQDREKVLAIIVRLTNDPEVYVLEETCTATNENLECIVRFKSRQVVRLWRFIFNRLNGDLWSVADRETGKMIWSMADQ